MIVILLVHDERLLVNHAFCLERQVAHILNERWVLNAISQNILEVDGAVFINLCHVIKDDTDAAVVVSSEMEWSKLITTFYLFDVDINFILLP